MAEYETVKLEVEDGIATLTLNRPDRMNAFTPQMALDMIAAFDETDADDDLLPTDDREGGVGGLAPGHVAEEEVADDGEVVADADAEGFLHVADAESAVGGEEV